jgi:hypothetical protein
MTFLRFYREAARRALHRAWELGHVAHATIVFVTGACVLAGLHFQEHVVIWVPFVVLLGAFLVGILWFAFGIYREEHTAVAKRDAELRTVAAQVEELKRRLDPEAEMFADLEQLIPEFFNALRKDMAEAPLVRDLIVTETKTISYNWPGPHLRFTEDEDPNIYMQADLLVDKGLLTETREGFAYRITDRLVRYLRKSGSAKTM